MPDGADTVDQEHPDSIQIKAMGVQLNAAGQKVVVTVIACAIVLAFGYFLYLHNKEMEDGNHALLGEMRAITYMLSLSQPERDKLHLDMPDTLRNKLRNQQGVD